MPTDRRPALAILVTAAVLLVGPFARNAEAQAEVSLVGKIQPPCKIVAADCLVDDWASPFLTLVDAKGTPWHLFWSETNFSVRGDGLSFHSQPGDSNERFLLGLLIAAYPAVHDPAFDDPSWSRGQPPDADFKKWYMWHGTRRLIRGLEIRCKLKRQPRYDEKVNVGPI